MQETQEEVIMRAGTTPNVCVKRLKSEKGKAFEVMYEYDYQNMKPKMRSFCVDSIIAVGGPVDYIHVNKKRDWESFITIMIHVNGCEPRQLHVLTHVDNYDVTKIALENIMLKE